VGGCRRIMYYNVDYDDGWWWWRWWWGGGWW
jgi:hypothetical protein